MALATVLAMCAPIAEAGQIAKDQKQAAASGAQTGGGSVPLRVGLVISDGVRSYKTMIMLTRIEFGRRMATQAEKVFNETFASVRVMSGLPSDPHGYEGLDLIVAVESPEGRVQTGFFSPSTFTLTVRFSVRNASGEEIFQTQETASEQSKSVAEGPDQCGQVVVRKFIQELILNPRVRALLAPAPAPEVKAVVPDTAVMDSSGLDVPPPPPWRLPSMAGPAPIARSNQGRP